MRLSGYQPQYFPRLHYFNRALDSDIFEISDYLQFVRKHAYRMPSGTMQRGKSFQAHTPIKLAHGVFHLVIPTHNELLPINQTKIAYSQNWVNKHLASIETGYRKSRFFKFFKEIEEIINNRYESLATLTVQTFLWGLIRLLTDQEINEKSLSVEQVNKLLAKPHPFRLKKIFLASESPISSPVKGKANDWIIALCKYSGATEYFYGGTSHDAYMDLEKFKKEGIATVIQDWRCPRYRQRYLKVGFITNLSIIDLVMNENLERRQRVMSGKTR